MSGNYGHPSFCGLFFSSPWDWKQFCIFPLPVPMGVHWGGSAYFFSPGPWCVQRTWPTAGSGQVFSSDFYLYKMIPPPLSPIDLVGGGGQCLSPSLVRWVVVSPTSSPANIFFRVSSLLVVACGWGGDMVMLRIILRKAQTLLVGKDSPPVPLGVSGGVLSSLPLVG